MTILLSDLIGAGSIATTSTNLAGGVRGSIPYQDAPGLTAFIGIGTTGTVLTSNGSTATWAEAGGGLNPYIKTTSTYLASSGDRIIADTSIGTYTITLPVTPSVGDNVILVDGADWAVNNLTVGRNGSTIESIAQDLTVDVGTIRLELVYDGSTWNVYASLTSGGAPVVANDIATNTIQYVSMTRTTTGTFDTSYVANSKLYFNPSTGILSSVDFDSLSDRTLKENIQPISDSISILNEINPVSFTWKDNGKKSFGVIAQEIEKILPEIVETNPDTGIKSVGYLQLISFLVAAVKQQQVEINMINQELGRK